MNGTKNSASKKPKLAKLYDLSESLIKKPKLTKAIAIKHEDWGIRLKVISNEAGILKNALQSKDKDLSALEASYKELSKKFKTLCKELQKTQKLFAKKHEDIKSKLLDIMDSVENTNQILFDATLANCKIIKEGLTTSKGYLDADARTVLECNALLKPIGDTLAKLLLPQTVESCAETSNDLKVRLEAIIQTTADMTANNTANDTPLQINAAGIRGALTLLRDRCTVSVKLLDIVSTNVNRVFPNKDVPDEKKGASLTT